MTTSESDGARPILRPFEGVRPRIHRRAWVAPGAIVVGDVEIGADSSIWYGTVIRADVHVVPIKNVRKPRGAKPGLVMVHGGKNIHLRRDEARLTRILEAQVEYD